MSKATLIHRQFVRYKRSDINVFIHKRKENLIRTELLNISQQGVSIRLASNLKLKKAFKFRVIFDNNKKFDLKGHIVNKKIIPTTDVPQSQKRSWRLSRAKKALCTYSICFNEASDDYKSYLLMSNMQIRLKKHSERSLN